MKRDDRRVQYVRRMMAEMEKFIQNRHVMEVIYIDKNGIDIYYRIAPICFKEYNDDWYLLALTKENCVLIFAIEYIIGGVGETEAMTTYSLPENFDIEQFKKRFFNINKVV